MLKQILFICCMLVSWGLYAQKPVEMKLWPEGTPDSNGITAPETWPRADRVANVSEPTLIVYPAARPNGLAVIACPGGGYAFLSMGQEGRNMAQWFNSLGITFAVLKYRMPNKGHHTVPLNDALQVQILLYPVITMDKSFTHEGSRTELLGDAPSEELVKFYSNELQVTPQTPPAFILHCTDDKTVPWRTASCIIRH